MIVGVLATFHTQYTWDRSICIFFFNRTTLQVFVTYLTGALYVHPLWFYKHQHGNRVVSTQNAFSLPFAAILVNCAPSGEMHNYCTLHIIKENSESFLIDWCNYILLSQVYCVWQVVKTPTVIFNNPVFHMYPIYATNCVFFCSRGEYSNRRYWKSSQSKKFIFIYWWRIDSPLEICLKCNCTAKELSWAVA